jgi:TatD DNase family protein
VPRFFDTHAHLDGERFAGEVDAVLGRADAAGITDLVLIGASDGFESNPATLAIVDGERTGPSPTLHATVGIHPHDAAQVTPEVLDRIDKLAEHPKVIAIGEMGLDYHYDHSPREKQQSAFRSFVQIANGRRLPCVVHTRDAEPDTLQILSEEKPVAGAIIHCFSGTAHLARGAVDLGCFISFSGILTFKKSQELRRIARELPRERVLVETDCPYLAPVPYRGKRNEPAYVVHTARTLAEEWALPESEVRRITGDNAVRAFGLN